MNLAANYGGARRWVFRATILAIMVASGIAVCDQSAGSRFGSRQPRQTIRPSAPNSPASEKLNDPIEVRRYFMDFDGDHSLDAATVMEQAFAGYARYTVQLQLASGAEQSFVVAAPAGGLQIEMHDMTGDKIPNDLVIRPALLRWLPTILVNDGHDHFAVAISGTGQGSLASSEDLSSQRRDSQGFALLMSSGFKSVISNRERQFDSQPQQDILSSFTQSFIELPGYAASCGRAPPRPTTI